MLRNTIEKKKVLRGKHNQMKENHTKTYNELNNQKTGKTDKTRQDKKKLKVNDACEMHLEDVGIPLSFFFFFNFSSRIMIFVCSSWRNSHVIEILVTP